MDVQMNFGITTLIYSATFSHKVSVSMGWCVTKYELENVLYKQTRTFPLLDFSTVHNATFCKYEHIEGNI